MILQPRHAVRLLRRGTRQQNAPRMQVVVAQAGKDTAHLVSDLIRGSAGVGKASTAVERTPAQDHWRNKLGKRILLGSTVIASAPIAFLNRGRFTVECIGGHGGRIM